MEKEAQQQTGVSILRPYTVKHDELQRLANDYKSLVVTPQTMKSCEDARLVLYRSRIEIQRVQDSNKKMLTANYKAMVASNDTSADELIGITLGVEKRLEADLNVLKEKQKAEAAEKVRKEEERKRSIKASIQKFESKVGEIRTCSDLKILDEMAENLSMEKDGFEEFNDEGNTVINTLLQAIKNRKIVVEGEKEAKDAENARLERIEKQNAIEEAELQGIKDIQEDEKEPSREDTIRQHTVRMEEESGEHLVKEAPVTRSNQSAFMPSSQPSPPVIDGDVFHFMDIKSQLHLFSQDGYYFGLCDKFTPGQIAQIRSAIAEIIQA